MLFVRTALVLALLCIPFALMAANNKSLVHQAAKSQRCGEGLDALEPLVGGVQLDLTTPRKARVGESITLSFHVPSSPLPSPVYLVVSTPKDVRFGGIYETHMAVQQPGEEDSSSADEEFIIGPGFVTVPPGVEAPDEVAFAADRMRAVAPLHFHGLADYPLPERRSISIKPLRAGPLQIEWAVVARPGCGEFVIGEKRARQLTVRAGRPEIVVQSSVSISDADTGEAVQPKHIVESNSGEYVMRVFDGRYEVFSTGTNERIFEGAGFVPNFSPTSRFVAARIGDAEDTNASIEIVDLIARQTIATVTGPTLAWSHGDSLVYAGASELQGFAVAMPLIDCAIDACARSGLHQLRTWGSGRDADAWNNVNIWSSFKNASVAVYSWDLAAMFNLFDGAARSYQDEEIWSLIGIPQKGLFKDAVSALLENGSGLLSRGWHGDAAVELSMICSYCDDEDVRESFTGGQPLPLLDSTTPPPLQTHRLVAHQRLGTGAMSLALSRDNDTQESLTRSAWVKQDPSLVSNRGAFTSQPEAQEAADAGLSARLSEFGLSLRPHRVLMSRTSPPSEEAWIDYFDEYPDGLQEKLAPHVPDVDSEGAFLAGHWTVRKNDRTLHVIQHVRAAMFGWEGNYLQAIVFEELADGTLVNVRILKDLLGDASAEPDAPRRSGFIAQKNWTAQIVRLKVTQHDTSKLIISAPAVDRIGILDIGTLDLSLISDVRQAPLLDKSVLTEDGRFAVQINSDGQLFVYDSAGGTLVVSGRHADDELILYDSEGHYTATYEGAHFMHLRFPGQTRLHSFQQFASQLYRPDIIAARLAGDPPSSARPDITAPPVVELSLFSDAGRLDAGVTARSEEELAAIRIYQDGQLTREVQIDGQEWQGTISTERLNAARWISAIAVDGNGVHSQVSSVQLPARPSGEGRLIGVVVGVDAYRHEDVARLQFAVRDAQTAATALTSAADRYYSGADIRPLLDDAATPEQILASLQEAVAAGRQGDTLIFYFAGHGVIDTDGRYYLMTSASSPDRLAETAVPWSRISPLLQRSKSRVVVFLDSCHSGRAGQAEFAGNDAAVAEIMSGARSPLLVISASKGRQLSQERADLGNGVFTYALKNVLTEARDRHDTNGNGSIEVSELYRGIKHEVVERTSGRQTPWLARSDLIGDFVLF